MKKIELSEDFFAASASSGSGEHLPDSGAMDVLLGRPAAKSAKSVAAPKPKTRTAPDKRSGKPPAAQPGMASLLGLPFELTRNMLTVMAHLFRAAIPNFRKR